MNPDFDPSEKPFKALDPEMVQAEIAVKSLTKKYNVISKLSELCTKIKSLEMQYESFNGLLQKDVESHLAALDSMKRNVSELEEALVECEIAAQKDKKLLRALLNDRINNSPYAMAHPEIYPLDFGDE